MKAAYRRVLVKLSGEQLAGTSGFGISPTVIKGTAQQLREVTDFLYTGLLSLVQQFAEDPVVLKTQVASGK